MFYDTFLQLCNLRNIAPTAAAVEIGFQKSVVTRWKNGMTPRDANLRKIADYFNVSVDYLLGNEKTTEEQPTPAKSAEDETLEELLERLKNREEMKMLFKLADGATKEDVMRAVAIIEALNSN